MILYTVFHSCLLGPCRTVAKNASRLQRPSPQTLRKPISPPSPRAGPGPGARIGCGRPEKHLRMLSEEKRNWCDTILHTGLPDQMQHCEYRDKIDDLERGHRSKNALSYIRSLKKLLLEAFHNQPDSVLLSCRKFANSVYCILNSCTETVKINGRASSNPA